MLFSVVVSFAYRKQILCLLGTRREQMHLSLTASGKQVLLLHVQKMVDIRIRQTKHFTTELKNDLGRFNVRWRDMHGRHPLIAFIPILDRNGNLDPTRVQVRTLFSDEIREIPDILELS